MLWEYLRNPQVVSGYCYVILYVIYHLWRSRVYSPARENIVQIR